MPGRCSLLVWAIIVGILGAGVEAAGQSDSGPSDAGQVGTGLEISADLDKPWQFVSSGADCRLEQPLGSYGTARFLGTSGQPLRFELLGHRDLFAEGPVTVQQRSPEWHPDFPARRSLGKALHVPGGGIAASDPVATRILIALKQGHEIWLERDAWFAEGQAISVKLTPVGVGSSYWQFTECFSGPVLRSWAEVERTRIGFSVGAAELDAGAAQQLALLAEYLRQDSSIAAVYIDGHTDDAGSAATNTRLAKQRAEAVAGFFRKAGVDPTLLVVRYHGARYPVADNGSDSGRAANRRATVRLERNWSELVSR